MFGTLLESVGKDTASTWLTSIRAPAVVFWSIGAFAWWLANRDVDISAWFGSRDAATLLVLLVVAAALLIGSSILLSQLARPLLRLLEGYWPAWLARLRTRQIARAINRQRRWSAEWSRLTDDGTMPLPTDGAAQSSPEEIAASTALGHRRSLLDQRLHDFPADERLTMPTRLGNVLRSSETYSQERYGLDGVVVWPALWLLLPDDNRSTLETSRRSQDQAVAILIATAGCLVWLPWSWLALIPALIGPPVIYYIFVVPSAQVFAKLVRATFDIHRLMLYTSLRFPPPADPEAELQAGAAVTEYLWRGFAPPGFTFATPPKGDPPGQAE